jgi:hypothetical protein
MPLLRVISKLNNIARIEVGPIIQSIFQEGNIQDEIIRLNTIDQLFEKGENSLGIRLENIGGDYSYFTILRKNQLGQPADHVTLHDTGKFYDSFEVIANTGDDYVTIKTNPFKDGENILDRWGVEVVGLNKENTIWLINEIRTKMVAKIKAYILAA